MKRLIPLLFLATPALAQQPPSPQQPTPPTPDAIAWQIKYQRAEEMDQRDLATAADLNAKLQAVMAEKADLQKKLDAATKQPDAPKPQ